MRSSMSNKLILGSLLLSLIAYATSESELLHDLTHCWNTSDELMSQVKPDDMDDTSLDLSYIAKKKNDQKCYAIQRELSKTYNRDYACFYQHQQQSRVCKESVGGWK